MVVGMKSRHFLSVFLIICLQLQSGAAKSQQEEVDLSGNTIENTTDESKNLHEINEQTNKQTLVLASDLEPELESDPEPESKTSPAQKPETKGSRKIIYQKAVKFANWIDHFFGEKKELESASYDYLRLVNNLTFREDESPKYNPRIKAKLHLPQLSDKTSLLFSTSKADSNEDLDSEENENDTFADEEDDKLSAALNYATDTYANSKFDFRVGIDSSFKTFAFIKQTVPLYEEDSLEIRSFNYLFWEDEYGFGLATQLDLNHIIDDSNLFRWKYAIRRAEKSLGNEWQNKFSLVNQLSVDNWMAYELGVKGDTEHEYDVESYRLSFRYRKRTSVDWLFFELEPEVRYDRTPESIDRELFAGVTFRLEVQFEN